MGRKQRERKRRPARQPGSRKPRKRILVVCEGEVTEPQYLDQFRRSKRNHLVVLEISREHGVPRTLVDCAKELKNAAATRARRERDDYLSFDEVWCVFDVDDHPNILEARDKAKANDIRVAISNPSFELWLLLHFCDNPGAQHRKDIARRLGKFVPNYHKHIVFNDFANSYEEAFRRARQMQVLANEDGEPYRNPTTGVFALTESIADGTNHG